MECIANGDDVNVTRDGCTPLFLASMNGHFETVKALLAANAQVNAACKEEGVSSLIAATQFNHAKIVKAL
jgi:ankyrin repeat protein